MPYAVLTPDGSAVYRVLHEPLPDGSQNYAAFGVLPVNLDVPEGKRRVGWQIVAGVAEPVLEDVVETPAPVPYEVSRRQFFLAVHQAFGLNRAQLRAMIQDEAALIDFDEAAQFKRDYPLLVGLAATMNPPVTEEQLDDLFRLAATFD